MTNPVPNSAAYALMTNRVTDSMARFAKPTFWQKIVAAIRKHASLAGKCDLGSRSTRTALAKDLAAAFVEARKKNPSLDKLDYLEAVRANCTDKLCRFSWRRSRDIQQLCWGVLEQINLREGARRRCGLKSEQRSLPEQGTRLPEQGRRLPEPERSLPEPERSLPEQERRLESREMSEEQFVEAMRLQELETLWKWDSKLPQDSASVQMRQARRLAAGIHREPHTSLEGEIEEIKKGLERFGPVSSLVPKSEPQNPNEEGTPAPEEQ